MFPVGNQQSAPFVHPHDAAAEGVQQVVQFLADRPAGAVESGSVTLKGIGPIEEQHVQVDVQVQGRAETLDQGDRAGTRTGSHGEARMADISMPDLAHSAVPAWTVS